MKAQFRSRSIAIVVGVLALVVSLSVVFSRAQLVPVLNLDPMQNLESVVAVTEQEIAALAAARQQAFLINRIPHPACPNCFKVGDGRYGIHEEVPGTETVLSRDLPDPAPLRLGEMRPKYDDQTGEPIWYIGTQGFVGPTDEEPLSASLPIPKIELKRIQARHEREIFKIKGVHGLGIGEEGFIVFLLPEESKNQNLIPSSIEEIPVHINVTSGIQRLSHESRLYRPVPLGIGIQPQGTLGGGPGTLGPHVVRDIADIGTCCIIWSLTAGHVIQSLYLPPGAAIGAPILQGGQSWGIVDAVFQLQRCDPNCTTGFFNDTRQRPDVGAIVQREPTPFGMLRPCSGSSKPVRRMQYGGNDFVHGPSGVIRIPTFSSCSSDCLKAWGVKTHAPKGTLQLTGGIFTIGLSGQDQYIEGYLDAGDFERSLQGGDSGALVAWNGSDNRQVVGLLIAHPTAEPDLGIYIRADYIKTAFRNAGISFDHYFGNDGTASRPSTFEFDKPC